MKYARRTMTRASPALLRSVTHAVLAVGLANLVAELGVYVLCIAPKLASGAPVPALFWILMYLPVLVACIAVGRTVASMRVAIACGVAAGLVAQIEKLALALLGVPGYSESLAIVAPARFWTVHLARMTFGFVVLFMTVLTMTRRFAKPSAPA